MATHGRAAHQFVDNDNRIGEPRRSVPEGKLLGQPVRIAISTPRQRDLIHSDLKGSADLGMRRKETACIALPETSLIQVEKFRLIDASVKLPITARLYARMRDELACGEIDIAARYLFDVRSRDRCAI